MWNSLTDQDVLNEGFNATELSAVKSIQGSDQVATIVGSVVSAIRGSVIAGGNRLDQPGTIPDQLRQEAVDIARWRILTSFPQLKALQTKERKDAHDAAKTTLKEVSKGEIRIELPAQPTSDSGPAGQIKRVSGEHRQFTRKKLKGIT